MQLVKILYQPLIRQALYQIVLGRLIERDRPEKGRFLRHDVKGILRQTWDNVDQMLPLAKLEQLPTFGNRHNVFLAVVTMAAYHALLDAGIEKEYAIELVADAGWRLYTKLLPMPRFIARLAIRDSQKQINLILRMLMIFPFSTPGRPGYEVRAWAEEGRYCTDWQHCPPYEFVQRYVEEKGDRGEKKAFHRIWCWYDWAFAYAMVDGGYEKLGHYERPHTLSLGDKVCDMRWYASQPE